MKTAPAYPMIRIQLKDENSLCLSFDTDRALRMKTDPAYPMIRIRLKDESSLCLSFDPDPALRMKKASAYPMIQLEYENSPAYRMIRSRLKYENSQLAASSTTGFRRYKLATKKRSDHSPKNFLSTTVEICRYSTYLNNYNCKYICMQFIASKKVIKYIMQDKNITMVVNNITVL
jgi:hypothetical protein